MNYLFEHIVQALHSMQTLLSSGCLSWCSSRFFVTTWIASLIYIILSLVCTLLCFAEAFSNPPSEGCHRDLHWGVSYFCLFLFHLFDSFSRNYNFTSLFNVFPILFLFPQSSSVSEKSFGIITKFFACFLGLIPIVLRIVVYSKHWNSSNFQADNFLLLYIFVCLHAVDA